MSNNIAINKVWWADSGDYHRGVGMIPRHAQEIGYTVKSFDHIIQSVRGGAELPEIILVVMTASLDLTRHFLKDLYTALGPSRSSIKIHLVMPDRGYPKSVSEFMEKVNFDTFDGIAHVSSKLRMAAEKRLPKHKHWYFHDPSKPLPSTNTFNQDRKPDLIMLSGYLGSGKGFLPFYQGANFLKEKNLQDLRVIHTGVAYTVSKSGVPGGGLTVLNALCETLKPKKLRDGVEIVAEDTDESFANASRGVLTAFPEYSDRELNMGRVSSAKALIVPILNEGVTLPTGNKYFNTHLKKVAKAGSLWASAIDYSIWETFAVGTPLILSREYVKRMIEPLGGSWPLPTYRSVIEAWRVAERVVNMTKNEWVALQKSQTKYAENLRVAENKALADSILKL